MQTMDDFFKRATAGELDNELAAAGQVLEQIAEAEGVKLSELSDQAIAELLFDLTAKTASEDDKPEDKKDEKAEDKKAPPFEKKDEKKDDDKKEASALPEGVTFADVSVELAKVAAAEGIDLAKLSRAEYHEAYDLVARSMTTEPSDAEKEAAAKLAEVEMLGRHMARAFDDESQKIADAKTVADNKGKGGTKALFGHPETAKEKVEGVVRKIKGHASDMAGRAGGVAKKVDDAAASGGAKLLSHLRASGPVTRGAARGAGYGAAAAGTLAAGGLAAAAHHAMGGKKKKSEAEIEAEALSFARKYVEGIGYNPDTADKVATDEDVIARANALLKEGGWIQ